MKIKIESAWKTLCDAFPKLKDNPLYKGWYISYAILVTLSILMVVVVNHRVVYAFPFDWFGLLFGIILPWVLTTFYIVYQGVDHAHQFTSTKVVLGLFMLPVILIGFTSNFKNEYSYSNRMVTMVFDQELTQQSFHATKITSNQLDYFKEDNVIYPYKKNSASEIYVFFRPDCPYCQKSIPVLNKSLTEKERNKIIYVNVLDESGKDLAKAMGVEKAATAVIYHKDKNSGGWSKRIERMAGGKHEAPRLDEDAIHDIVSVAKEETK